MKLVSIVNFYIKKNWLVPALLLIAAALVYYVITGHASSVPSIYTNFWDPYMAIFSIALTIGLTVIYISKEWLDHLPRKLNVHFINTNGHYLASCYNVNVVTNADLRTLGQQVGAQMLSNQQIKFSPSLDLFESDVPLKIKNAQGHASWIKYSNIKFYLTSDQYNEQSSFYTVWNIQNHRPHALTFAPSIQPFHALKALSLKVLLSEDEPSLASFKSIEEQKVVLENKLYIVNSPIIDGSGIYDYKTITMEEAIQFIEGKKFESAIGFESTADVLSALLKTEVKYNRIQIKLHEGDQCLVFRLKDRIEEGKFYTADELLKMNKEFGIITKKINIHT
jgi:Domain of unknown function (DUF1874)